MPEIPPPPQQPLSSEQSPRTPTGAFKRFMSRWNYNIVGGITGVSAVRLGMLSVDSFAKGDTKSGTVYGILATVSSLANVINTAAAQDSLNQSKKTIEQQQKTIQDLQGKNRPK
jgi:hypothetical protein